MKIKVERQSLLGTSKGTRDNVSIKSFKNSEITNGRLFSLNIKTGSIISGKVETSNYLYSQKNGKITARFLIQEIL